LTKEKGASQPKQITVTNKSAVTIPVTGTGIGGADNNDFRENDTCGGQVAAAGSCTMTIMFKATQSRSAAWNGINRRRARSESTLCAAIGNRD